MHKIVVSILCWSLKIESEGQLSEEYKCSVAAAVVVVVACVVVGKDERR